MKKLTLLLSSFLFLLLSRAPQATATQLADPQTLTIMTHDSFAVSEEVIKSFEEENNAKVVFL
ncbi:MAG: thiamine ABC transporter substrate-binding protein, partial [Anaerolineales bacterium]